MRTSIASISRWFTGVVAAVTVASGGGCMFDSSPPPPHSSGSCFIGGCGSVVCSDRPDIVSVCIWYDYYVCYRDPDAICARQTDGTCGWTQTDELKECFAEHGGPAVDAPGSSAAPASAASASAAQP